MSDTSLTYHVGEDFYGSTITSHLGDCSVVTMLVLLSCCWGNELYCMPSSH